MTNVEVTPQTQEKRYEIISYEHEVQLKYTLPDEEEPRFIEHELTFMWEDSLEKFKEEHSAGKPYRLQSSQT